MKSIVTIGGGTGQFTLLGGLKRFPVELTAIVSMADDGGSTGMLRDELGVLPPGDIRQCLVALSESEAVMRELFSYRFDQGVFRGHNFGNIFLSALEKITGSFEESVRVSGKILAIRGSVVPVTTQDARLVCEVGEGATLVGEHQIDTSPLPKGAELRYDSDIYANPRAVRAIEQADCVVIGPGGLYDSIIPNLLVRGIPEAIRGTKATLVFNCNLMNKPGHTDGFSVSDYVETVERHIGRGRIDFVTYNNRMPEPELLERYAAEWTYPVLLDQSAHDPDRTYLAADLLCQKIHSNRPGDSLARSLIRHDPDRLARLIIQNCLGGI